ncbi:helix-turn-helix domain-containing protein [Clostridium hydrogenum]|uniref:helix-turn-helix domain-containing protein n=1 Tax=Clostridium hydrogenum TaxID=2855764 RepID=UPI001F43170B|nr:helix-turn-helix domain-containing protein [Clostridium hydrogenum]
MDNYFSVQIPFTEREKLENKFKYEEILAIPELADTICCYWNFSSYGFNDSDIVLMPDPCSSIIIDLNNMKDVYILGPLDKPFKYKFNRKSEFFGIKLLPGRFSVFSSIPIESIKNRVIPLDSKFYDSNKLSTIKLMKSDMNSLQSYANEEILNSKEYSIIKNSRLNIFDSIEQIYIKRGNICISDLAQISNCSIRTLSRKYDDMVGMNPKFVCRIIRFQYTLFCYYNNLEANLADLAVMSGYYDQSHFYKDFKEFLGISPSRLISC